SSRGAAIVGFPEASLTGYVDPRKYPDASIDIEGPEVSELRRLTANCPPIALVGLVERNPEGKPFITQIALRRGELLGIYRKRTIAGEEAELFSAGVESPVFMSGSLAFGIAICADIEDESLFSGLRARGARLVFELAAPGLYGDQATRNWSSGYEWWQGDCAKKLGRYARGSGLWIAVVTQAGRTVDEDFPGGGFLFSPDGERRYATPDWNPCSVYLDII
ncbi:MAG: nitrilase-related carbon-nitrogen hydrolase, partial [Spirochaetaceae bacterium]|nr:nitrilase-related carbon-nitrogen hydrolase [Spirochaetaceae bacterium]